ncbi:hypothetical protein BDR07DRAFT_1502826 [Suillus spraguei]|nr:hypothetical protein BDR07DRAFT_1502826 [Suillus spraguei]
MNYHVVKLLPTILKVTEDDTPGLEALAIFYMTYHPGKLLPTILKVTEDDTPSLKAPAIVYQLIDLVLIVDRGAS